MQILITSIMLLFILFSMTIAKFTYCKELHFASIACFDTWQRSMSVLEQELAADPPPSEKKKKTGKNRDEGRREKKRLSRFLNIGALFDASQEKSSQHESTKLLFVRLIEALYKDQPFYKDAQEYDADISMRIVDTVIDSLKELKNTQTNDRSIIIEKIKKTAIRDPALQDTVYRMLCGTRDKIPEDKNEDKKFVSYYSFCDFIRNGNDEFSLWLAPRPVLLALFQDEGTVDDICKTRASLFREMRKDKLSEQQVHDELKNTFSNLLPDEVKGVNISYRPSLTKPVDG